MPRRETDLDLAQRHVAEAEVRIERQKQIIAEMERDNHPQAAETARQLLATFCETVELMRAHLAELRDSSSLDLRLRARLPSRPSGEIRPALRDTLCSMGSVAVISSGKPGSLDFRAILAAESTRPSQKARSHCSCNRPRPCVLPLSDVPANASLHR